MDVLIPFPTLKLERLPFESLLSVVNPSSLLLNSASANRLATPSRWGGGGPATAKQNHCCGSTMVEWAPYRHQENRNFTHLLLQTKNSSAQTAHWWDGVNALKSLWIKASA